MPRMEGKAARLRIAVLIWFVLVIAVTAIFTIAPRSSTGSLAHKIADAIARMRPGDDLVAWVLFLLLTLVATFAAVAIHEMAHALVGVLVGFRFNSLRVGRLQFDRPFRISLYKGRGTGANGWASLFPVKHDKLIWRAIAMVLAGPLSNLLSIAVLLALPYSKGAFSIVFIYVSAILGVVNLIPLRGRAVYSDGGRILMLLQNRARGERWLAMLKLVEEMRTGPPEKMTPEFIAKAIAIEGHSPDTVPAHAIAYAAAFWAHKDDEAARMLETCLRHSSLAAPSQRQGLAVSAAVFQARRRCRPDLAQQWLAEVPMKAEFPWLRPQAEAAILEAQGNLDGARARLDEVEKLISATPNQALRQMSLRNVQRWKDELQA
jgi:hypothetical protein